MVKYDGNDRRENHECVRDGEIEVLKDFKTRTETWINGIGIWFVTNVVGLVILIAGVVVLIVRIK